MKAIHNKERISFKKVGKFYLISYPSEGKIIQYRAPVRKFDKLIDTFNRTLLKATYEDFSVEVSAKGEKQIILKLETNIVSMMYSTWIHLSLTHYKSLSFWKRLGTNIPS